MSDEQKFHVLIVDDNEMNRDMLARRLARQGYQIATAENGEQGLAMIRDGTFDLVLLDVMMPKLNGYEVLEQVKADSVLRDVPVIMISAVDDLDSVVRCIELGAEDYLFKPFNPVLLKARISASLERRQLQKQQRQAAVPDEATHDALSDLLVRLRDLRGGQYGSLTDQQAIHLDHVLQDIERLL